MFISNYVEHYGMATVREIAKLCAWCVLFVPGEIVKKVGRLEVRLHATSS